MQFTISFLLLAPATFVYANPIEPRQQPSWYPYTPCISCLRSSWPQGPECTTDPNLKATISRVLNPPASEIATYTPSQWCSAYLLQTDWSTQWTTTSLVNTYRSYTIVHHLSTTTDYDHPTSILFCPSPSPQMECGWDSNTVAPWVQQGDTWIEHSQTPEQCQQLCLERTACRAYRMDGLTNTYCEIFNLGLGVKASNVINPTPNGNQWWDRNCQEHVPKPCRSTSLSGLTAAPTPPPSYALMPSSQIVTSDTPSRHIIPTSLPSMVTDPPAPAITPLAQLVKRDAPFPSYLEDLSYAWSSLYMIPACSCIISSAGVPVLRTTKVTATEWTAYTSVTETIDDFFVVTETARQTTVYVSVE